MAKKLQSIGSKRSGRKKQKPRLRSQGFIFPRKVAFSLASILLVCMCFLYLHNTNKRLGNQIKKLEGEAETARYKALNQVYRWEDLTTPDNIERELARHGLDMKLPEVSQVVVVESVDFWLERGIYGDDAVKYARREGNR